MPPVVIVVGRESQRAGRVYRIFTPYRYLGADDRAGPNYTGQPAVDAHYEPLDVGR